MALSAKEQLTLKELERSAEELKTINERQEKRVGSNRARAESFSAAFLLLQALFLVAISARSSSPNPNDWLVYFAAILLSSFVFFAAFFDAVHAFYWTRYELDRNYLHLEVIRRKIREAKNRNYSSDLESFHVNVVEPESCSKLEPDEVALLKRKIYIYFMASTMFSIVAIELYACRFILCREN